MKSFGHLERKLRDGQFVLTAETTPPDAGSAEAVLSKVAPLQGLADAVNVTDGAGARAHMSALAVAAIMARSGLEPVLQMTARDRNRLALEADLMGAAALGIPNILCLHGDDITKGDEPEAKPVWDIDSKGLMRLTRRLRDEGTLPSGRAVSPPPRLLIGGADTPQDPPQGFEPKGLADKIAAGCDFFQTQFVFDLDSFARYMSVLRDHGIAGRAFVIAGVGPITSAKSARWMNANLFGVHVPEAVIARIERAGDEAAEGRRICLEVIDGLRQIPGVAGAHVMSPRGETTIAAALIEARRLPGLTATD